jgi:transcriptional regulator with XRE-family HTH domain
VPPRGVPLPRLREWRVRRALEQGELAEKARLARYTVIRLESGERAAMSTIRRLARALKVDPEALQRATPAETLGAGGQEVKAEAA